MDDNKKIAFNSVVVFLRLCISSLVGIIAARVVLDALGASDYGLYNVVGGIVALLNVVNTAMMSTTYRFTAFEIGKKEAGNPNKVFNTSLTIHGVFAIFIIILGLTLGLWYINNYLNVEPGKIGDARFVFFISLLTTAISTLFVPYQGLLVAYEKFSITASIEIFCQLLKLGLIFAFIKTGIRIRTYSLIMMVYTLSMSVSYALYCKHKYGSVVKWEFNKQIARYKEMMSYALWTLFGAVANIGKSQGSTIIINFFFGTIVNAAYAVANQVEGFIITFARSLNSAAIPQITKNYSVGNMDRSITLTTYISKYTYFLMSIVALPVLLEMDFLLGLWLKDVPEGAVLFCKLFIINGLIGCLGEGIPALVNATGNIKTYQLVFHTFNLLGLPIAFVVFKMGAEPYAILVVYILVNLFAAVLRLWLLKRIFKFDVSLFVKRSYWKILLVSIPLAICYYLYNPSSFTTLGHLLGMVLAVLFLFVVIFALGLDSRERTLLRQYVSNFKDRIKNRKG